MARQWRIEYPGAYYHVLSRGNDRQNIFRSDRDRKTFLKLLANFPERFQIEVFAFVLMDNHYHLLLRTLDANLSRSMQWLNTSYTRRFNMCAQRSGHLFQGRYKSIIIENEAYLLTLSCYIHRNPLRAGMVERLADYRWSSYRIYAYGNISPRWLKTDLILDLMHGPDKNKAYRRLVQEYANEKQNPWKDVAHGLIYGSAEFTKDIRDRFLSPAKHPELPQKNSLYKQLDPETLLAQAADCLCFNIAETVNYRHLPENEKHKRDLLIYLLWESGRLSNQEIGDFFGLGYSAISRRAGVIRKKLATERELSDQLNSLKSKIKV